MKRCITVLVFIFLVFSNQSVFADLTCHPTDPSCDEEGPDPDAPIDGGLGLLIGATAFYTINTIRKKQRTDKC